MPKSKKTFKIPPKKYHPKGLSILYEDHDILVVEKASGLLTVSTDRIKDNTAYYHLNSYVKKGNQKSKNRVFIVHRLDRDTSGILVFAKSEDSKRFLQDQWHGFKKKYYALFHGMLSEKEGIITSYLAENRFYRVSSVNDPEKGKLAKTGYKVLKESKKYSLLEIDLFTGRKNQIRVHFAEKGFPVVGDKIYGEKDKGIKRLALHSAYLSFLHPVTKEQMTFETALPAYFKSLLNS
ncbi:MAG: RluA family pseudouridine synthase [Spirochaetaceae bacterium]|jgi:RluA family pseudouridine synthase|nr:RluA family pseudouridine synthase [Spirochaetaceae bacterium]